MARSQKTVQSAHPELVEGRPRNEGWFDRLTNERFNVYFAIVLEEQAVTSNAQSSTTLNPDVIVVGAGIAGCLTAYLLAKSGASVTILEADSVGSHASGFAFGGLGPLEGAGIPEPILDFSVWSFERHKSIYEEMLEETGIDTQFHLRDRLNWPSPRRRRSARSRLLPGSQSSPGSRWNGWGRRMR